MRINATNTHTRRAFSLLEMLVVLVILVIVMSIVIPALSGARNAARKAATEANMSALKTAGGMFSLDNRRLPGYFNAKEMGDSANTTGFTALENMLLDLAGGPTDANATGAQVITVGPGTTQQLTVKVDLGRIGAATQTSTGSVSKVYFTPDPKYFAKQDGVGGAPNQRAAGASAALTQLPVLVDAWGSPILAWQKDSVPSDTFASANSRTPASFYWQSNSGFLQSRGLGKLNRDQTDMSAGSLLGDSTKGTVSMEALLGNPGFSNPTTNKPTAARAPIVLHCAGTNGIYLGKEERGGKQFQNSGVPYRPNQDMVGGGAFDDFFVTAGE